MGEEEGGCCGKSGSDAMASESWRVTTAGWGVPGGVILPFLVVATAGVGVGFAGGASATAGGPALPLRFGEGVGDAAAIVAESLALFFADFLAVEAGAGVGVAAGAAGCVFAIFGSGVAGAGVGVGTLTVSLAGGGGGGAEGDGATGGNGFTRAKRGGAPGGGGPDMGLSTWGPAMTGGATGG